MATSSHRLFTHFVRHTRSTIPIKRLIHASSSSPPPSPPPSQSTLSLISTAPQATTTLAHFLASPPLFLHHGDCFLLHGQVGAGKSHFTRSFIRAAANDPILPVPSPTYLLMNAYELSSDTSPPSSPLPLIHHYDLYRLTNTSELMRLDFPTSFSSAITLIEWPDILLNSSSVNNDQVLSNYVELRIALLSSDQQTHLEQQHSIDLAREDELVDEEDWYDDDDGSGDDRWRQIQITLVGEEINSPSGRWKRKLGTLASHLNTGAGRQYGLSLLNMNL